MAEYPEFIDEAIPEKKSNTGLIIAIVVIALLLCCCCVILAGAGWFYGDEIMRELSRVGFSIVMA